MASCILIGLLAKSRAQWVCRAKRLGVVGRRRTADQL
jgi:hypothetical protein